MTKADKMLNVKSVGHGRISIDPQVPPPIYNYYVQLHTRIRPIYMSETHNRNIADILIDWFIISELVASSQKFGRFQNLSLSVPLLQEEQKIKENKWNVRMKESLEV